MRSVVVACLLAPALAFAQPKTADDWYKEGETQYNLGEFEKAAEAFKAGFAAESDDSKKSAYLYNVAQAYRQGNKCRDAAFFYKRYLSLKDQDTEKPLKPEKRAEIDQRIAELEECARNQQAIANKPPTNTQNPGGGTVTKPGTGTPKTGPTPATGTGPTVGQGGGEGEGEGDVVDDGEGDIDDGGSVTAWEPTAPKVISARFVVGGSKISAGDLPMGVRATFALTGGYPVFVQDKLVVEAGAALQYTAVPFENNMTGSTGTASLMGVLANGAATYVVAPKISVRGDLGLGILSFGGITEMGNPFTEDAAGTSGPLTMFALRVGVSADYEITSNIVATATPFAFTYSPAKEGLRSDISSITRIDFMVGVGYRM